MTRFPASVAPWMALRAIAQKRPAVRRAALTLALQLATSEDPNARRIGRPIVKAFPDLPN